MSWFAVASATLAVAGCTIDAHVATLKPDAGGNPDAGGIVDVGGIGDVGSNADVGGADAGSKIFETVPAGMPLRDEATCATLIRRTSNEPRPMNTAANHTAPTATQLSQLAPWDSTNGFDNRAVDLQARISGSFMGTTDEILQWAACKWGFDEDLVRAEAAESTSWNQGQRSDWTSTTSDCPMGAATRTVNGNTECAQTYGMLQVVWKYHKSFWPMYRDSTAFHLDFVLAMRRVCFEGYDLSQGNRVAPGQTYKANDLIGCLGAHFSGVWYDDDAAGYVQRVQSMLAARPWEKPAFCTGVSGCVLPR